MPRTLPRTLVALTLTHVLVDTFASFVQPLWPDLQRSHGLGDAAAQAIFVAWNLATSVSQLLFGIVADRARGRWMVWTGTAVGVVGVSLIGTAGSAPALAAVLIASGLGIAAFHPEAAALAGDTAPHDRSRAMSIFALGGYLGMVAGPVYSGIVTTRFGLPALVWSAGWGLAALAALSLSPLRERQGEARPADHSDNGPPPVPVNRRSRAAGLVVAVGVLRTLPMVGVPVALAYLIKAQGGSNAEIGWTQSFFSVGVGIGGLGCAVFLREVHERRALAALPALASPWLLACPILSTGGRITSVVVVGLLLGAAVPILTSYGQRLLHDAQRVASALTMGVAWGLGGVFVAALMAVLNHLGQPAWAFPAFAASALVSGWLCRRLPDTPPSPRAVGPAR